MNFSKRLQHVASLKKIFQADLADAIGKDRSTVNKWWNGSQGPGPRNMRLLADYFGCSQRWLETGEGKPFPEGSEIPEGVLPRINSGMQEHQTMEDGLPMVRNYRELAQMDVDTLGEIQTWINDMEQWRPGFTSWFRLEFQNRFPEFDDWKSRVTNKKSHAV